MNTTIEEIFQHLQNVFGMEAVLGQDEQCYPHAFLIAPDAIALVCKELQQWEKTYFDQLSCITGLDNGPEAATLEVVYNLYSIPYDLHLTLKVVLPRNNNKAESLPEVPTVSHIWRTADWHEREAYDLVGIHFTGHPDLRRILLPTDWEGYPLRKDYEEQDYYHGIKVGM